jgi:hypothetical protein
MEQTTARQRLIYVKKTSRGSYLDQKYPFLTKYFNAIK